MKLKLVGIMVVGLCAASIGSSFAADLPPVKAMKLSAVVQSLEAKGYSAITEISMDHGVWEVEVYKEGAERELRVDPVTAAVLSDRLER